MSPEATDTLKTNLGETGVHLKQAAADAGNAIRSASAVASDELRLGKANVKSDLADGALAGMAAMGNLSAATGEQVDQLMDKGRDLLDSAADLIRERPLASFGVAFATGWIIAKLARSGGSDK